MTTPRVRWVTWSLVAIAFLGWWIRSYQVGEAVGGPLTYRWSLEVNSWRGTAAIILSESNWGFGFRVPWGYWEIPDTDRFRETVLGLGLSTYQTGSITNHTVCWPIPLPFLLLLLGVEGPAWLRRWRAKSRGEMDSKEADGAAVRDQATG